MNCKALYEDPPAPEDGDIYYNIDSNCFKYYDVDTWKIIMIQNINFGIENKLSNHSIIVGSRNECKKGAMVIGFNNSSSGNSVGIIGRDNLISGDDSLIVGSSNHNEGRGMVVGDHNSHSSLRSLTIGSDNHCNDYDSLVVGSGATTNNYRTLVVGSGVSRGYVDSIVVSNYSTITPRNGGTVDCRNHASDNSGYAEMFEWARGGDNGLFVGLEGGKLIPAKSNGEVIGVSSQYSGFIASTSKIINEKVIMIEKQAYPKLVRQILDYCLACSNTEDLFDRLMKSNILPRIIKKFYKFTSNNIPDMIGELVERVGYSEAMRLLFIAGCNDNPVVVYYEFLKGGGLYFYCRYEMLLPLTIDQAPQSLYKIYTTTHRLEKVEFTVKEEIENQQRVVITGKAIVLDYGKCTANKCDCLDGIAVNGTRYHVLKRVDADRIMVLVN